MRVLIIEDDVTFSEVIGRYFRQLGCQVMTVHSWREGLEELKSGRRIELITLDLRLPDSTAEQTTAAVEVLRRLQEEAVIIVISAFITPSIAAKITHMTTAILDKTDFEAFASRENFFTKLAHAFRSAIKSPTGYQHSVEVLERFAQKLLQGTR